MEYSQFLDYIASLFILLFILAPRFNNWALDTENIFSGKPKEYIDSCRYSFYLITYLTSYIVIGIIINNFPELFSPFIPEDQNYFHSVQEVFGKNSYTVSFLILTMLLNHQKVNYWEETWRNLLHKWARIPGSVNEIKHSIINSDCFSPSQKYIDLAINEVNLETAIIPNGNTLRDYWVPKIENWKEEKEKQTIDWYYIKCLMQILIARDITGQSLREDLKVQAERIKDIGKIIPFIRPDNADSFEQKKNLEELSSLFIEHICKHIVKTNLNKESQFVTFKNLGFDLAYHDAQETKIALSITFCLLAVAVIIAGSTGLIINVLDRPSVDWVNWSSGGFIAITISIFIGIFMQKISLELKLHDGLVLYFTTFVLAMIGALIYFQWGQGDVQNFGRWALALSFASISVIVFRSLSDLNTDTRDVLKATLVHTLILGIYMSVLQMIVSRGFALHRNPNDAFLNIDIIMKNDWQLLQMGAIGFLRGSLLAGFITYIIQDSQRRQQLSAFRTNPRAPFSKIVTINTGGNDERVTLKNFSKSGLQVKCGANLKRGDKVAVSFPFMDNQSLLGIVQWTRRSLFGKQHSGIRFDKDYPEVNGFIRSHFGPYYA